MENQFKIELSTQNVDKLQTFSAVLKKDINTILDEALNQYFEKCEEKLHSKADNNPYNTDTNLDFNEFWDDVDI
jgi:predicted transcriptional regulator